MTQTQERAGTRSRTYGWSDPAATVAALGNRTGVEVLKAIADGELPSPPIMATLGIEGVLFETGRAVFSLVPDEMHYNPLGSVHGGVIGTCSTPPPDAPSTPSCPPKWGTPRST
jgi:hypothetical protein